jgi:hypothetical protein
MLCSLPLLSQILRWSSLMVLAGIMLISCGYTRQKSGGPISDKDLIAMARGNNIKICAQLYNRAKDAFQSAQWNRALELTKGLAAAPTSRTEHTHLRVRSQTLRTVIYTGLLKGNMDLSPFLTQTVKTQNPMNGELSHGSVTQAVHQGVQAGRRTAAGIRGIAGRGSTGNGSQSQRVGSLAA